MALAQGPGVRIAGGGLAVPAYARVYAQVQPILTGLNPGTYDANGQYLHFKYRGNLNLGARSGGNQVPPGGPPDDFMPNYIEVEFDAQSYFTLPFEGELQLVGGSGEWKFGLFVHDVIDKQFYQPALRTLRSFKTRGSSYTIPDNHTFILGTSPTSSIILPGGAPLAPSSTLPGTNITAGTQVTVGPTDTWVTTGWLG